MTMKIWVGTYVALVLVTWTVSSNQSSSGMRVTVAETALKEINIVELERMRQDLQGKTFPGRSGKDGVHWELYNIRIASVGTLTPGITLLSTNQIVWNAYTDNIIAEANWRVWKRVLLAKFSTHGDARLSTFSTSVAITMGLSAGSGKLSISSSQCSANVGSAKLDLDGSLPDFVYSIAEHIIEGELEADLAKMICDAVKKGLTRLSQDMETLDTTYNIKLLGIPMVFDNSFTAITTTNNQITTLHKAAIQWQGHRFETNTDVSLPAPSQRHIAFDLREDVLVNLLEAMVQSGQLNGDLTYKEIMEGKMDRFRLTCKDKDFKNICFGKILKQSAKKYPDRVVALKWTITKSSLNIEAGSLSGKLVGRADFSAANATNEVFLFSAQLDLAVYFQVRFSDGAIETRVGNLSGSMTVDKSNIGKVFTDDLLAVTQDIILINITQDIEQLLNKYNSRFPIKLPRGVSFKTSKVVLYKEFIRVEADVCYKDPKCKPSGTDKEWVGSTEKGRVRLYDVIPTTT